MPDFNNFMAVAAVVATTQTQTRRDAPAKQIPAAVDQPLAGLHILAAQEAPAS
jgi:hypothetical protein